MNRIKDAERVADYSYMLEIGGDEVILDICCVYDEYEQEWYTYIRNGSVDNCNYKVDRSNYMINGYGDI